MTVSPKILGGRDIYRKKEMEIERRRERKREKEKKYRILCYVLRTVQRVGLCT